MIDVTRPIGPVPRDRARPGSQRRPVARGRQVDGAEHRGGRRLDGGGARPSRAAAMPTTRALAGRAREIRAAAAMAPPAARARRASPRARREPRPKLGDSGRRRARLSTIGLRSGIASTPRRPRDRADAPRSVRRQPVGLVHDDHLPREPRQPRRRNSSCRTASWYFSGSVTQATASTRGSTSSTRARCSGATESMSGRSRIATGPRRRAVVLVDLATPSQSSSGPSAAALRARAPRPPAGRSSVGGPTPG